MTKLVLVALLLLPIVGCAAQVDESPPVEKATCDILGYSTDGETQLMVFNFEDVPSPDINSCKSAGNSSAFICKVGTCLTLDFGGTCRHCGK